MTQEESSERLAEREALLRKAYEGEVDGEAIFSALSARATSDHHRSVCRLIEEIELVTGEAIHTVVLRHGVEVDTEAARARGEAFAEQSLDQEWEAFWVTLRPLAADA